MRRTLLILLILAILAVAAIFLVNLRVGSYSANKVYKATDNIPAESRVAIVFGARVWEGGVPSNTLYDRVLTAVELYKAGHIGKLLLSGGNDEPDVMKKLAVDLGVPESDIVTDALGTRTYETCFRAKNVFGVETAVLVTQDYHLSRAIYLCNNMGIESIAVDAKRRDYVGERYFWFREYFSRIAAWFDINFRSLPPEPADKQPIER